MKKFPCLHIYIYTSAFLYLYNIRKIMKYPSEDSLCTVLPMLALLLDSAIVYFSYLAFDEIIVNCYGSV